MQGRPSAIFLIHLVQDVNILRPLVFMAAHAFQFDALLLVSTRFTGRDVLGLWRAELEEIRAATGARLEYFNDNWEAQSHLSGRGLIFAASESDLPDHATPHQIFRHAPGSYLKVTLQHGFECVGFRHSADHVRAHGETASFGADIVCAWFGADQLTAMAPSQRSKLWVTGPTSVLQKPAGPVEREPGAPGLVCENLHSVRLSGAGFKAQFMDAFADFARRMEDRNRRVALRPHPGGQYFARNRVSVPGKAELENAPLYRLDLRRFSYGISAPSSVLIDLLLAEIPTAVWRDRSGAMDADNYAGLTTVATPREWVKFAQAAEEDPAPFLKLQKSFLEKTAMPLEPSEVFASFAGLFKAAGRMQFPRDVRDGGRQLRSG